MEKKTMVSRTVVAVALLFLLGGMCVLCGCGPASAIVAVGTRLGADDEVTRKAEYEFGSRTVVVVPFRDERHTYGESPDGMDLAVAVTGEMIRNNAVKNLKSAEPVRELLRTSNPETVDWAEVARQAGAQLVLSGDIQQFTLKDPKHIMIVRGTCKLNYFVYDAAKNAVVYSARGVEVYYPDRGAGIPENSIDNLETLRSTLLAVTAQKVVQKFYTYKEVVRPPPSRY
jgi:hypothetical protein